MVLPKALAAQCNPCHTCGEGRNIDADGASTIFIESPENPVCRPECEDFGEECTPFAAVDELREPLLRGESPSVTRLAQEHGERLRYIPGRNMVVVLGTSDCEGEWILAFPVREDEVGFVRESVAVLE